MTITLTDDELKALREMVSLYIGEGFTRCPTAVDISVVRKLGLTAADCWPYEKEYAEAFNDPRQ